MNRAGKKIYGSRRWQNTRRKFLFEHPLCQCENPDCHAIATDVHHRKDLAAGGDPWDPDNLMALEHACHSRITRRSAT